MHSSTDCDVCPFHNPSDHHMKDWVLNLRMSGLTERVCAHGVGHPDPDSLAWFDRIKPDHSLDVHGCDGCCIPWSPVVNK